MKKIIMLSMIALAAAGFLGCGNDDTSKADVKWTNNAGSDLKDIAWLSGGKVDQSWAGTVAQTKETGFKGISELAGEGDCLFDTGAPAAIELSSSSTGVVSTNGSSAVVQENAAANLVISNAVAK